MPLNKVIIATAGSRKTTSIVEESLGYNNKKILVATYTIENLKQIQDYFIKRKGFIPSNILLQSWFSFLLCDGVRPFRNWHYEKRIEGLNFPKGQSVPYIKESNIKSHYFDSHARIYSDKISKFACKCNKTSNGSVIKRIENIYDYIFIDEVQDLAGYDFDFLELLLLSKLSVVAVGDSRQATYFTNCSQKNRQFKGSSINELFKRWQEKGICIISKRNDNYRCNQAICDFSDKLYPEMSKSISKNCKKTDHDGIYFVSKNSVHNYTKEYSPKVLRYSKITDTYKLPAINFGQSKGQNFNRVLIFPNKPIRKFLKKGVKSQFANLTRAKFYVALTRARYSVAFCYDGQTAFEEIKRYSK